MSDKPIPDAGCINPSDRNELHAALAHPGQEVKP